MIRRTRASDSLALALDDAWCASWAGIEPVAADLKWDLPDNWLRIHSLPAGKRYPDSESEYRTLLDRHLTIIRDLDAAAPASFFWIIGPEWSKRRRLTRRAPVLLRQIGTPVLWGRLEPGDDTTFAARGHLWATTTETADERTLAPLLRDVADAGMSDVIIAPQDFAWLFLPYDGGADIIAQPRTIETMRASRGDWLSDRPDGL